MAKKSTTSYSPFLHLCLALLLMSSSSTIQSKVQPTGGEQHALRTVMRDWGNPAGLRSWSTGNWTGVTCNSHGLVTSINAKGFNIANPIPSSLCSLSSLSSIDLSYNHLSGHFPTVLYGCSALLHLDLSGNRFTNNLPSDIHNLSSRMQHLNLSRNGFTGGIGPVLNAINLIELDLSKNRLTGPIPETISNMKNLGLLLLCCNNIVGPIPPTIGSLPALKVLDLSNNKLSGHIPHELGNLLLSFLNLSSNNLTGQVPRSMQTPAYNRSFLGNRGLCVAVKQGMSLPSCALPGYSMRSTGLIILCTVLTGVVLVGALIICCTIIRHLREDHVRSTWKMTSFDDLNFTQYDVMANLHEENLVGSGGFGNVYRVQLPGTGQALAVKKISTTKSSDLKLDKQFHSEVNILGNIRHNNIVRLLCCIFSENTKILVYEYTENSSLDHLLHRPEDALAPAPLDYWPVRLSIAIDVARGLSHMHDECTPPIMHRDIKSSNILLDGGFHAKIGDFGLARFLQSCKTEVLSMFGGTIGYIAPELCSGRVNDKVDVYSFGVVLLELTTGRVACDPNVEFILAKWASNQCKTGEPLYNVVDKSIKVGPFLDDIVDVFKLGVSCTNDEPKFRPSMKIVLEQLLRYDRTQTPE